MLLPAFDIAYDNTQAVDYSSSSAGMEKSENEEEDPKGNESSAGMEDVASGGHRQLNVRHVTDSSNREEGNDIRTETEKQIPDTKIIKKDDQERSSRKRGRPSNSKKSTNLKDMPMRLFYGTLMPGENVAKSMQLFDDTLNELMDRKRRGNADEAGPSSRA